MNTCLCDNSVYLCCPPYYFFLLTSTLIKCFIIYNFFLLSHFISSLKLLMVTLSSQTLCNLACFYFFYKSVNGNNNIEIKSLLPHIRFSWLLLQLYVIMFISAISLNFMFHHLQNHVSDYVCNLFCSGDMQHKYQGLIRKVLHVLLA